MQNEKELAHLQNEKEMEGLRKLDPDLACFYAGRTARGVYDGLDREDVLDDRYTDTLCYYSMTDCFTVDGVRYDRYENPINSPTFYNFREVTMNYADTWSWDARCTYGHEWMFDDSEYLAHGYIQCRCYNNRSLRRTAAVEHTMP